MEAALCLGILDVLSGKVGGKCSVMRLIAVASCQLKDSEQLGQCFEANKLLFFRDEAQMNAINVGGRD